MIGFFVIVLCYTALSYLLAFTPIVPLFSTEKSSLILSQFSGEKIMQKPQILIDLLKEPEKLVNGKAVNKIKSKMKKKAKKRKPNERK
jgi:hypothetical protein